MVLALWLHVFRVLSVVSLSHTLISFHDNKIQLRQKCTGLLYISIDCTRLKVKLSYCDHVDIQGLYWLQPALLGLVHAVTIGLEFPYHYSLGP